MRRIPLMIETIRGLDAGEGRTRDARVAPG
jgi:hypothetical protein